MVEEQLHRWALSLTGAHNIFSHDAPLEPHHFSVLVQDKKLGPCFAFLARHIRPVAEVNQIKNNLRHARIMKNLRRKEKEKDEEDEEHSTQHEFLRLKSAIAEVRSGITAETTEIQHLNQKREELVQSEAGARRKGGLMRVVRQDGESLAQHYTLWNTHLKELREEQHRPERKAAKVTLAVKEQLHEDLQDLERLNQAIIGSCSGSEQPFPLQQMKERLWENIGRSVEEWSPRMAVEAVIAETRDRQHSLRRLLQDVDLNRDAKELRVKCESDGTFIDETNPSGVIESVQELLRQMSAEHVRLHLQAHREKQAADKLRRVLTALTNNITSVAKRTYEEEEVASAVLRVVNATLGLVGERAALAAAQTLTAALHDKADTAARLQASLKDKHARICNFEKEVQERIKIMQCLAGSTEVGRKTLKQLVAKLKTEVESAMSLTTTPTPASSCLAAECERVEAIPLAHLQTIELEASELKPKINLSTAPLACLSPEVAGAGWQAVSQLCGGVRCWDGVYQEASRRLLVTATLHRQIEHLNTLHKDLHASKKHKEGNSTNDWSELMKKVESHDHTLEKQVTFLLSDCERQLDDGFQLLAKFTQHMADWWEPPAKKIEVKRIV